MVVNSWTVWILHSLYPLVIWMDLCDSATDLGPLHMALAFPALVALKSCLQFTVLFMYQEMGVVCCVTLRLLVVAMGKC